MNKNSKGDIFSLNKHLIYRWDLIYCLVDRNIKILYKRSSLGILWMLIKPLLTLCIYGFVFRSIIPVKLPFFTSYVFTGLLFWNWFNNSVSQCTGVIVQNVNLIKQPYFPINILPIVIVITEWIHLLLAIPILFFFILWESVPLEPVIFLLPFLMLLQFTLILSIGCVLAAINVTFRDTQHTVSILLQMLMYLSGIFYDINTLKPEYQSLLYLNPMVHLLNSYRSIIIYGEFPSLFNLVYLCLLSVCLLPIGIWIFRKQSCYFVEEL
ncbi:ABC transporter permease [Geminocystis sp. NIES-3709]|uniref:ABC transporter permease n=1 Tax=Geminocystis sp. NIES-3709 TaxID=1617448 RepID=UPI0005FCDBFE|nr:ABC transporter permease [Geminocystis sp. NIES-3709]BAQ64683.1 O-antigen export system permease protein RfbD [Geminocystis sp. NIES-3709]